MVAALRPYLGRGTAVIPLWSVSLLLPCADSAERDDEFRSPNARRCNVCRCRYRCVCGRTGGAPLAACDSRYSVQQIKFATAPKWPFSRLIRYYRVSPASVASGPGLEAQRAAMSPDRSCAAFSGLPPQSFPRRPSDRGP